MAKKILLMVCLLASNVAFAEYSRTYMDAQTASMSDSQGVNIAYKTLGDADSEVVVLIMGLGASHSLWGDTFVKGVESAGYRVVLIDNRDTGASTRFDEWGEPTLWWELLKNQLGFSVTAPYLLNDMAADVVSVMDSLEIDRAHIVGASMGGMIAQIVAADYPQRTQSLISIMSTTGAPHLPPPSSDSSSSLMELASNDNDENSSLATEMKKRGFYPEAVPRQLMAIIKTGDRTERVKTIEAPTLVLHGANDTLIPPAHGQHTTDTIAESKLVVFEGMGHDMPEAVMPAILAEMTAHMALWPVAGD
jgi:pimeloyl-ACP methyl ester carboxylesterase